MKTRAEYFRPKSRLNVPQLTEGEMSDLLYGPNHAVIPHAMYELAKEAGISMSGYVISEKLPVGEPVMDMIKRLGAECQV